jgi:hypothetical protein
MDDEDTLFFVVAQLKTKRIKNNEIRYLFIVDKLLYVFNLKIITASLVNLFVINRF